MSYSFPPTIQIIILTPPCCCTRWKSCQRHDMLQSFLTEPSPPPVSHHDNTPLILWALLYFPEGQMLYSCSSFVVETMNPPVGASPTFNPRSSSCVSIFVLVICSLMSSISRCDLLICDSKYSLYSCFTGSYRNINDGEFHSAMST